MKEHRLEVLLKPFIDDLKVLAEGYTFQIHGKPRRFRGSLICFCGDTPASNYVAGFKEAVGDAYRKCRECMATGDDMQYNSCIQILNQETKMNT